MAKRKTPDPASQPPPQPAPVENGNGFTNGQHKPEMSRDRFIFELGEITSNILLSRGQLWATLLDNKRRIDEECDYPPAGRPVTVQVYKELYDREAIPARVVEMMPRETWQATPQIRDGKDGDEPTQFEEDWDDLCKTLQPGGGPSWHEDEHGSAVWEYFERLDILSRIGQFGVMLLGFDDGRNLQDPVEGSITVVTANKFCPTGQGGGVDPTCGKDVSGSGTKEDPYKCGADIKTAAKLLAAGHHIQLDQPDQVATLTDKLAKMLRKDEKKGNAPKKIDMCKVSVPDTNLFCQETVGIPRVNMPQMRGIPVKGSKADELERVNKAGKVDISAQFIDHLKSKGIETTQEDVRASHLRASQNEIDGRRVIELTDAVRDRGKDLRERPIFITKDNYVLDGHHHWAALTVLGAGKGKDYKVPVYRLNIEIGRGVSESSAARLVPMAGVLLRSASASSCTL